MCRCKIQYVRHIEKIKRHIGYSMFAHIDLIYHLWLSAVYYSESPPKIASGVLVVVNLRKLLEKESVICEKKATVLLQAHIISLAHQCD